MQKTSFYPCNKTTFLGLVLTGLMVASWSTQAVETSGNVAITTDYRFRGISQTDTSFAIQGGFDFSFEQGFYAGVWASNIDFADDIEMDWFLGYATDLSESVSLDLGYIYYDYPGTEETIRAFNSNAKDDYQEIFAALSYQDLTVGVHYSDDYYLETGEFVYIYADYGFELSHGIGLSLHYGLNLLEFSSTDGRPKDAERAFLTGGADDYVDYSISLSKDLVELSFSLSWVGTDLDDDECFGSSSLCDDALIFSVAKEF